MHIVVAAGVMSIGTMPAQQRPDFSAWTATKDAPAGQARSSVPAGLCMADPPTTAPAATAPAAARIAQIGWLSGVWVAASGSEERWTPPAGGSMLGVSRTLRKGVMSAFEFLCITERAGGLVYQAMPNGRSPATDFMLTAIDASSATFENPAHDFPKKIRYSLSAGGTLEATISGDAGQRPITFTFRKQPD
jgi:hypothetical protein